MTFKEWLINTDTKQRDAAEILDIDQSQVSRIAKEGTTVLSLAIKIREMTGGQVTVDDLLPQEKVA